MPNEDKKNHNHLNRTLCLPISNTKECINSLRKYKKKLLDNSSNNKRVKLKTVLLRKKEVCPSKILLSIEERTSYMS